MASSVKSGKFALQNPAAYIDTCILCNICKGKVCILGNWHLQTDEHRHVMNCRKYPGLGTVYQFGLWSWGKSAGNLQIYSLMPQVSKRNLLMGKLLKFQMIIRQKWIIFSDNKVSICVLISFVSSWLWLFRRTVSMQSLSKVKKASDSKGRLVSQAPVPHGNPSFQAGRCKLDDSRSWLILISFMLGNSFVCLVPPSCYGVCGSHRRRGCEDLLSTLWTKTWKVPWGKKDKLLITLN